MEHKAYYIYIVRCEDDTLYTGIAADPAHRLRQHLKKSPTCAKYTRSHPVRELVGLWQAADKSAAMKMEYAIKQFSREKKQRLLSDGGNWQIYLPTLREADIVQITPICLKTCLERNWNDGL